MTENDKLRQRIIRDLWTGLSAATFGTLLGVFVFALAELSFFCWLFRPPFLARVDPRYLMETSGDEYMALSLRLIKLRVSRPTDVEVAYLGGSQATRALATRNFDQLTREITRAAHQDVTFNLLSSNNQRFEDALGITDQLPPTFRGVVVMMVSDYKDDYGKKSQEKINAKRQAIALVSAPSEAAFWREFGDFRPRHTGIFFLDHLGFFAARRVAALRFSKVAGNARPGAGRENEEKYAAAMQKLERKRERQSDDDEDDERRAPRAPILGKSRAVIQRLMKNMKRRGVTMVFLENIHNPLRAEVYAARIAKYQDEFRDLVEAQGALYWDFNDEMHVRPRDFQDSVHLGTQRARRQFQNILMRELGKLIRDQFGDGDTGKTVEPQGADVPDDPDDAAAPQP